MITPLKFKFLSDKYVLLTGATGLVGRYLMRDLLLRGTRLAVIVRPKKRESARQRIESILASVENEMKVCVPRPVVIEGDVTVKNLGMSTG